MDPMYHLGARFVIVGLDFYTEAYGTSVCIICREDTSTLFRMGRIGRIPCGRVTEAQERVFAGAIKSHRGLRFIARYSESTKGCA